MVRVGFKTREELARRRKMRQKSRTIVGRPIGVINPITFNTPLPSVGRISRLRKRRR